LPPHALHHDHPKPPAKPLDDPPTTTIRTGPKCARLWEGRVAIWGAVGCVGGGTVTRRRIDGYHHEGQRFFFSLTLPPPSPTTGQRPAQELSQHQHLSQMSAVSSAGVGIDGREQHTLSPPLALPTSCSRLPPLPPDDRFTGAREPQALLARPNREASLHQAQVGHGVQGYVMVALALCVYASPLLTIKTHTRRACRPAILSPILQAVLFSAAIPFRHIRLLSLSACTMFASAPPLAPRHVTHSRTSPNPLLIIPFPN